MGFEFTLATVLRYRQSVEKQEELLLSRVLAELSQVRSSIESLTFAIESARNSLADAMRQTIPAVEVAAMTRGIDELLAGRQKLLESEANLAKQCEAQYEKYLAAHSSRKALTEMQVQQLEQYELEHARLEQKRLDEIYAARAQRG